MALLTDEPQERRVVERVRIKAATFGQDIEIPADVTTAGGGSAAWFARSAAAAAANVMGGATAAAAAGGGADGDGSGTGAGAGTALLPRFKVSFDALADIYDRIVMPLTKDVQVKAGGWAACLPECLRPRTPMRAFAGVPMGGQMRHNRVAV
jgi:chorismate mutase